MNKIVPLSCLASLIYSSSGCVDPNLTSLDKEQEALVQAAIDDARLDLPQITLLSEAAHQPYIVDTDQVSGSAAFIDEVTLAIENAQSYLDRGDIYSDSRTQILGIEYKAQYDPLYDIFSVNENEFYSLSSDVFLHEGIHSVKAIAHSFRLLNIAQNSPNSYYENPAFCAEVIRSQDTSYIASVLDTGVEYQRSSYLNNCSAQIDTLINDGYTKEQTQDALEGETYSTCTDFALNRAYVALDYHLLPCYGQLGIPEEIFITISTSNCDALIPICTDMINKAYE